jgi:hypothetical protein
MKLENDVISEEDIFEKPFRKAPKIEVVEKEMKEENSFLNDSGESRLKTENEEKIVPIVSEKSRKVLPEKPPQEEESLRRKSSLSREFLDSLNESRSLRSIEIKKALSIHENDMEFLKENADEFIEGVNNTLRNVKKCLRQSNFDLITKMSDTIIGAGNYLGAEEIIFLAETLKAKSQEANFDAVVHCREHLEEALSRFKTTLDRI